MAKKSAPKKSAPKKNESNTESKVDVFASIHDRASKSVGDKRSEWEALTKTKGLSDSDLCTVVCEKIRYGLLKPSIL